jgi:uncharacterized phage protein (TIGR01671 family)
MTMREILFRGKRKEDGKWIEGYLAAHDLICPSYPEDTLNATGEYCGQVPYVGFVEVDPESVGQSTALKDNNGKRIFEGDIVRTQPFSDRPYSKKAKFKQHIGVVRYDVRHYKSFHDEYEQDYKAAWDVDIKDYDRYGCCSWSAFYKCEVIGNIHDNPELMGGDE